MRNGENGVFRARLFFPQISPASLLLCGKLLINTRLQPGAKSARTEKPFKRFFWARLRFTALKRGVNEMIFMEHLAASLEKFLFAVARRTN
jgi:hypothetical protein